MVEQSLVCLQRTVLTLYEAEQLFWALLHGGGVNRRNLDLLSVFVYFLRDVLDP
jgi:hypothetical protein